MFVVNVIRSLVCGTDPHKIHNAKLTKLMYGVE